MQRRVHKVQSAPRFKRYDNICGCCSYVLECTVSKNFANWHEEDVAATDEEAQEIRMWEEFKGCKYDPRNIVFRVREIQMTISDK